MNIGEIIKKRRTELNLSADYVADKIGKSRATLYRYENGDIEKMPLSILIPLASVLNTTPAELMGFSTESRYTIQEQDLINNFRKLNQQGQDYIIQTMNMVKDKYPKDILKINDTKESNPNDKYLTTVAARGNSELKRKLSKSALEEDLQKPMSTGFDD